MHGVAISSLMALFASMLGKQILVGVAISYFLLFSNAMESNAMWTKMLMFLFICLFFFIFFFMYSRVNPNFFMSDLFEKSGYYLRKYFAPIGSKLSYTLL